MSEEITEKSVEQALNEMAEYAKDQRVKVTIKPDRVQHRHLTVTPVLAVCYQAMMEVPCERALAEKLGITLARFLHHFADDSIVVPILMGKERLVIGAMWFKDGEVHLAVLKSHRRGKWITRLKDLFAPGFKMYGPKLTARVNKRNRIALRFTDRIGGKRVGEDELAVIYELHHEEMMYD